MGKKKKVEQDGADRVPRGGGWSGPPASARGALQVRCDPGFRLVFLGVRLIRRRSALERLAEAFQEVSDGQG
jgi:formylglycine-generating enzyme required for sulfatase activity